jgi:hypothetical protein
LPVLLRHAKACTICNIPSAVRLFRNHRALLGKALRPVWRKFHFMGGKWGENFILCAGLISIYGGRIHRKSLFLLESSFHFMV